MDHFTRTITILVVAINLSLIGCTQDNRDNARTVGTAAQNDHEADDHDGHDHGDDEYMHDDHAHEEGGVHMHADGDGESLGTLTIDDTTVGVVMMGEAKPGSAVDIEVIHTDGPVPAAVRMWIGVESGLGSLKIKAHTHGDHYHGVVEVPAELADSAALWIEIESPEGTRVATSIPIQQS
jgi:hypothetical protein